MAELVFDGLVREQEIDDYMRGLERHLQVECVPHYANDRQAVFAHPYPAKHWCEDHKARLRWRVTPHPVHGRWYVLHPRNGEVNVYYPTGEQGPGYFAGVLLTGGH
jgi:hypothetical protein